MGSNLNAQVDTADIVLGVVRPFPGQESSYCGVSACSAFRDMLINALTPRRYSKVGIVATVSAAAGVVFAAQTLTAFANVVGDNGSGAATGNGFPVGYTLTRAETNYLNFEDPVPQNSNVLFCVVGMTASLERPWSPDSMAAFTTKTYPTYITQGPDYRETAREDLYCNTNLQLSYGNNGCTYDIDLVKHYPNPNTPQGGDTLQSGVIAAPLMFSPLNSVVCIDSLKNNRRAVINVTLNHALTIPQTSLVLPVGPLPLLFPLELALFGFIFAVPTPAAMFVDSGAQPAQPGQKPAGAYFIAR